MKTPQKPIPELQKILHTQGEIWFKFENKHHLGSHKGRSIPAMIDAELKSGQTNFVISSSGNAALAALRHVTTKNKSRSENFISLHIFVGRRIGEQKLAKLEAEKSSKITIEQVDNPKQSAFQWAEKNDGYNLRASMSEIALAGYETLSEELNKIENLQSVFVATSSGTAAVGLGLGFKKTVAHPQIHIVQTTSCHPIADFILKKTDLENSQEPSLADAIVDKIGHRKEELEKIVKESGGTAWIIGNKEIAEALEFASEYAGEKLTANSALALAGLIAAQKNNRLPEGNAVCIIGGD